MMWERPMSVELVMECRVTLREYVDRYDCLIDAMDEIDLWPVWKEIGGDDRVPWGNFQHLFRDELRRRFGSDGRSDSPMSEI